MEDHVLRHCLSLCGKLFNIEMGIGGCSKVQDHHFVLGYLGAGLAARPVFFHQVVRMLVCALVIYPYDLKQLALLARWLA